MFLDELHTVDMMEVLLGLIRASREANWVLHLAMIKAVI